MGTNLIAPLDSAPQTGVEVRPLLTNPIPGDTREVLRCPSCELVQFPRASRMCRRCHEALDAPPPQLVVEAPVELGRDAGVETAEATGTRLPDVAGAIRLCRQRLGLSQRQLAARMQVPRTYVSKIENDKATPTLASLERMAGAMQTSIAALLEPGAAAAAAQAEVLGDSFVRELLTLLPRLSKPHMNRLLAAGRQLAARA